MRRINKILIYLILTIVAFVVCIPFIWLIINSFKTNPQMYKFPIEYIPNPLTFDHYKNIWIKHDFPRYFLNSMIISGGAGICSVLLALLPAYAFSRFNFRGNRPLLLSVIVTQMFPPVLFVIPFFLILKNLDLINNYLGMILVYLPFTTPVAIWMITNFYKKVPIELEEAAFLDGCNVFQTFYKITLPLAIPGIASVGIYAFLFSWGELMLAMSYLPDKTKQTLPIMMTLFVGQYNTRWGEMFAGAVISAIPSLIIFTILQKYFVEGLTTGSVKG